MTRSHLTASLVALAVVMILASSAMAGGEPKNLAPFMRPATRVSYVADWFERYASAHQVASVTGEPKNVAPFTQPSTRVSYVPDWFERYATAHPYSRDAVSAIVTMESRAFSWRDALLGAAATAALALVVAALALTRRARGFKHALGA